jgi:outer membrane protein assembly factor BamA
MRPFPRVLPCLLLLLTIPTLAQTYTPKQIVVHGADTMDPQQIISMTGLKPGPMTKQDIEAALQRLVDTGSFDDVGYTVSSTALTLNLTPSAAAQLVPVRFTNFVWWTPSELTALIQARVPLYQGKLSLKGGMLDQVEAALVAILKEKGIEAEVTPIEGFGGHSISLAIARPAILLGNIQVQDSLPAVASKLSDMKAGFATQEFDEQILAKAIPLNTTDLYHDAGFLDATADPVTFAPPRKDNGKYFIDATTTVHPGEIYRIHQLTFNVPPGLSRADSEKAVALKPGDPAGTFPIQHASDALAHAYYNRGYLDAKASPAFPKDPSTHTVDLTFTVISGEIYYLAAIDASRLPPSTQAAIAHDSKLVPGVVVDQDTLRALQQRTGQGVRFNIQPDHEHHLAAIVVIPLSPKL